MDGLSAAASVAAVITIALQSTKFIHDAVSKFKDGPAQVQQLAAAVEDLHRVLKQLARAKLRVNRIVDCEDEQDLSELKRLMDKCVTDLRIMEEALQKVQVELNEGGLTRVRRRTKIMLREDAFSKMSNTVHNYVSAIGLQLEVMGRYVDRCTRSVFMHTTNILATVQDHGYQKCGSS